MDYALKIKRQHAILASTEKVRNICGSVDTHCVLKILNRDFRTTIQYNSVV